MALLQPRPVTDYNFARPEAYQVTGDADNGYANYTQNEFDDNLTQDDVTWLTSSTGNNEASATIFKYPNNVDTLPNFMVLYFDQVESEDQVADALNGINPTGGDAQAQWYYALQGNVYSDVPNANQTYQGAIQNQIIGSTTAKIIEGVVAGMVPVMYKRTTGGIVLPMPQSIKYPTQAGWENVNDGGAIGMLNNVVISQNPLKTGAETLSTGTAQAGGDAIAEGLGSVLTKSAKNTFQDQTFKGMQRRIFQFSWVFAPKNKTDLVNLYNIITKLRFQSHPLYSPNIVGGNYLLFPGQVDIEWYTQKEDGSYAQNEWLPKLATSVIEAVETDFTPNNQFSFFKNAGAPTHYTLTIAIKETVPLSKLDIARGF